MKKLLVLFFLFPGPLLAQSPFDGTWIVKLDVAQLPKKPDVLSLQSGVFECSTCVPKIKVKADGKDYPIAGSPYFSTVCVKEIENHGIEFTEKLGSKTVYSETDTLSADGNTLSQNLTDSAAPNGESVVAQKTYTRLSGGPAGSSPISGSWQVRTIKIISENGSTVTYHATSNGLEASNPGGEGYAAKFDGKEYPVRGDPSHSTVSLKRLNDRTIEETDRQGGEVHYKIHMAVSSDGKSMKVTEVDAERGTKMTYVMQKKSS